jgi:DNA repair exonuclease SbcCD ATPase subunit
MLKISLHNFRCWDDLTLNITLGSITLIKGSSGVGKSTIFQSIYWCLYGTLSLVSPNNSEKLNTSVSIELPYTLNGVESLLNINRQKNPKRLLLSHNNTIVEDKVAQSIINNIFGDVDLWLSSCYIVQGYRNKFLDYSNNSKLELLNCISFNQDDPSKFFEPIDKKINDIKVEHNIKMIDYTKNLEVFQNQLTDIDLSKKMTDLQINDIEREIFNNNQEINRLNSIKSKRDINVGMLDNLQKQLSQIVDVVIPTADNYLVDMCKKYNFQGFLTNFDSNFDNINEIIHQLKKRDDFISQIKNLETRINNKIINKNYTIEDYQLSSIIEQKFYTNKTMANSLGVEYTQSAIESTIKEYKNILASQTTLKLQKELDILKANINSLESENFANRIPLEFPKITEVEIPKPDYNQFSTVKYTDEVNELSKEKGILISHIKHLEQGLDVIKCPNCDIALRYKNGNLNLAEIAPSNKEEIVNNFEKLNGINNNILQTKKIIQELINCENKCKCEYEYKITMERKRLENLREINKQIELKEQHRQTAIKMREQQILDTKIKYKNIYDEYKILNPDILNPNVLRLLSAQEIENMHKNIAKLSNIEIILLPECSSKTIKEYMDIQIINDEYQKLLKQYDDFKNTVNDNFKNENVCDVKVFLEKIKLYQNNLRTITEEKNRLDILKKSLLEQIENIKLQVVYNPEFELKNIIDTIDNLKGELEVDKKRSEILKFHNKITFDREEVVKLTQDLKDLETLKQYAKDTECMILEQVVESINCSIESVCNSLFDRDINIKLNLYKKLKTSENIKAKINFDISYQGGKFDNIDQLSGGEGDRASIALTLALKRLSSCPILMLDESLASLDLDIKETTIQSIRENITDTVIIIMHDGIEGIFDEVINVNDLR